MCVCVCECVWVFQHFYLSESQFEFQTFRMGTYLWCQVILTRLRSFKALFQGSELVLGLRLEVVVLFFFFFFESWEYSRELIGKETGAGHRESQTCSADGCEWVWVSKSKKKHNKCAFQRETNWVLNLKIWISYWSRKMRHTIKAVNVCPEYNRGQGFLKGWCHYQILFT